MTNPPPAALAHERSMDGPPAYDDLPPPGAAVVAAAPNALFDRDGDESDDEYITKAVDPQRRNPCWDFLVQLKVMMGKNFILMRRHPVRSVRGSLVCAVLPVTWTIEAGEGEVAVLAWSGTRVWIPAVV